VGRVSRSKGEREIEQVKIEEERRSAAALMALQARETRLLREQEGADEPAPPEVDFSEVRALASLMKKPVKRPTRGTVSADSARCWAGLDAPRSPRGFATLQG